MRLPWRLKWLTARRPSPLKLAGQPFRIVKSRRGFPQFEILEDRKLLVITVDTLLDELDGSIVDGDVSLRDAIRAATSGETVDFHASLDGGTILLTLGEVAITDAITLDATALAGGLTIDASGNDPTPGLNDSNGSRIFEIDDGDADTVLEVAISGLTLTGGDVSGEGGAIRTQENLTVTSSTISGNSALDAGGIWAYGHMTINSSTISGNSAGEGGGIYAYGAVTVTSSTISANSANIGGGILAFSNLTVSSSTISGNSARRTLSGYLGVGGGIRAYGTVAITASTISGNSAGYGGGISASAAGSSVTVTSSTISGNSATGRFANSGGIWAFGTVTVTLSTISGNSVSGYYSHSGGIRAGGGTITNSIVAGNSNNGTSSDLTGVPTVTFSLIGGDPMLAPLANNGGPTQTHALLPGSPAINAGDPAFTPPPDFDQRGAPFLRVFGGRIDMGAFELQIPTVLSILRANQDPTGAASVGFTVTFSQEVTGVDTSDFVLAASGTAEGTISGVAPISGSVYAVTVDGIVGAGTLRLDLVDDDSIIDSDLNSLGGPGLGNGDFVGEYYTVDRIAPVVQSIVRTGASPTGAQSVSFGVTFDEEVTGVNVNDFMLTFTGSANAVVDSVTPVSVAFYIVTVDTITGLGTVRLDLADDDSITDLVSNPLGGIGPGNGDFTGEAYTVDRIAPLVQSIVRASADPATTEEVQFTVTFSEDVTGVDASDFALVRSGSASGVISAVLPVSADIYMITVEAVNGVGTLRLDVVDNDSIVDAVSNKLGGPGSGNGNFMGEAYTVFVPVLRYTAPTGNGPDNLTLLRSGNFLVIVDNRLAVLASLPIADTNAVVVQGANGEADRLTVDYGFGGYFAVPGGISFDGGADAGDALAIVGTGATSGTNLPSGVTAGAGSVLIVSGSETSVVTFTGLEPVEISNMTELTLVTPNGSDMLVLGSATGSGGQIANKLTGSSSGLGLESLTFFDVTEFHLDIGANDELGADADTITMASNLVARNLAELTVTTGTGGNTFDTGSVNVIFAGTLSIDGNAIVKLMGNVLVANTLDLSSSIITGFGIAAALTLDFAALAPSGGIVNSPGPIGFGTADAAVLSSGFANLGQFTTLDGGTIEIPNGLFIGGANILEGNGVINGKISSQTGSTIAATGNFTLGNINAFDGFFSDGSLLVNNHAVTIHDRNVAVLGSVTELGNTLGPGTLSAPNGLLLEDGKTLSGYGIVDNAVDHRGQIVGEGPIGTDELEFTGNVTGAGHFDGNIRFSGMYSPGGSPALIDFGGNAAWSPSSTLKIELNGLQAGTGYDRLEISGTATLDGTLEVNTGFSPPVGAMFDVISFGSAVGDFAAYVGLDLGNGLKLVPELTTSTLTLRVESFILGDMARDGDVDFDDISPFVLGLTNPAAYEAMFGVPPTVNGDVDQDGAFDFDDIDDFVAILSGSLADLRQTNTPQDAKRSESALRDQDDFHERVKKRHSGIGDEFATLWARDIHWILEMRLESIHGAR